MRASRPKAKLNRIARQCPAESGDDMFYANIDRFECLRDGVLKRGM